MDETNEQKLTIYEPVRALQTANEAQKTWEDFEALKKALLNKNDYQKIGSKAFIKRSGFRKIAVAFGLSDRILEEEKYIREDNSFYWRIVVEVKAPNGRINTGVGICDSAERDFAHIEHDVYATSHTRAKSRAISDMVAGGVVSAEELDASFSAPRRAKAVESTAISRYDVESVQEWLQNSGVPHNMIKVEQNDENGMCIIRNINNNYDTINPLVWPHGFSWIRGGKRWEREI